MSDPLLSDHELLRRQARIELRHAIPQLNARGLYYAGRWCAELATQIELSPNEGGMTTTSTVTSAMQSRLNSNSKATASKRQSGNTILPPPSFEDIATGLAASRRSSGIHSNLTGTGTLSAAAKQLFTPGPVTSSSSAAAAMPVITPFPTLSPIPPTPAPAIGLKYQTAIANTETPMEQDTPTIRPNIPVPPGASGRRLFIPDSLHPSPSLWDEFTYAKSLFDLKEFARCAHVLRDVPLLDPRPADDDVENYSIIDPALAEASSNGNVNLCLFLRCYALYLSGEKRKEEESLEKNKSSDGNSNEHHNSSSNATEVKTVINRELRGLQSILAVVLRRDSTSSTDRHPYERFHQDGHLWFLYGLVLRDLGLKSAGRQALLFSVTLFPWNWSAWQALANLQTDRESLEATIVWLTERTLTQFTLLERQYHESNRRQFGQSEERMLPSQPYGVYMKEFFYCDVLIQLQSNNEDQSLAVLEQLCALFPDSIAVRSASAIAYYNKRCFPESQHLFELLQALDPYRWEHMDTYSNILFVNNDFAKLSFLAHQAFQHDKYRLQTCCIIGNYYSLRGDRERAILYFKRALKLNPNYLSAWTLMGHEYVELRNTNMAIESYRKAIDINPLDYRAWYGLGQTYEILQMNQYSIYYFKKACQIKPYDPRMWCAIGENYEKLSQDGKIVARVEDAIQCYLRAEENQDVEGVALNKLAQLYRRRGKLELAAEYYRKVLTRHGCGEDETLTNEPTTSDFALHPDAIDGMLFLAEYYFKHLRQYEKAEAHCNKLLDNGGSSKDAAKSLLIEIRQAKTLQLPPDASPAAALAKRGILTPSIGGGQNSSMTPFGPVRSTSNVPNSAAMAMNTTAGTPNNLQPHHTPIRPTNPSMQSSPDSSFFS